MLITGASGAGKSRSLKNIRNQDKWIYNCCEAGKKLPFKNDFIFKKIINFMDVYTIFDQCSLTEEGKQIEGAVIDTIDFLMDMVESQYVLTSGDSRSAWGDYNQYFKRLLQNKIPIFNRPVIVYGHTKNTFNELTATNETKVPVKGALANTSVEAYFTTVVTCKRMPISVLKKYNNSMLNITEDELELGYKHVFQTRPTKDTIYEGIKSPEDMFSKEQTFIDNDAQLLLDHIQQYYAN